MFNKPKVYTRYEDIPKTIRNQFHLTKFFKSEKQYNRFMKWQNVKKKCYMFYWSPSKTIPSSFDEGKTVTFSKAKRL